tara:strand:- start:2178 stop:3485 length:1308 start_codon:yes stop_codon:yes gene_type:complete
VIFHGDCLEWLGSMEPNSVDACVTDPPYGLGKPPPIADVLRAWLAGEAAEVSGGGFMGRSWDAFVPGPRYWLALFRVMKPGAHAVVFAGQRTVDVMGIALRLGGFEVRDVGGWAYWSGFPKSLDVSKAIDREAGAVREVVGVSSVTGARGSAFADVRQDSPGGVYGDASINYRTAPATPDAKLYAGFGTALKPAIEPWILVRKPISEGSIARNVLRWGTGAINIDGCRFAAGDPAWVGPNGDKGDWPLTDREPNVVDFSPMPPRVATDHAAGRWPANLYYCPKASTAEREAGCGALPLRSAGELVDRAEGSAGMTPAAGAGRSSEGRRCVHPTVKALGIMRWLCRLVTPPGGLVVDPFTGSGTTGIAAGLEGLCFEGAELNNTEAEPFVQIARARMAWWALHGDRALDVYRAESKAEAEREARADAGQLGLWGGS